MKNLKIQQIVNEYGKLQEFIAKNTLILFPSLYFPKSLLPYPKKTIKNALNIASNLTQKKEIKNACADSLTFLNGFIDDKKAYLRNNKILRKNNYWKLIKKRKKNQNKGLN